MGDASHSKNLSPQYNTPHTTLDVPPELDSEFELESEIDTQRLTVLYSHSKNQFPGEESSEKFVVCNSFDELLLYLEDDRVDSIWFDESVNPHEKSYITGWARIFRPDLTTYKLQTEKIAN